VGVLSAPVSHCEPLSMAMASFQNLPLVHIELILAKVPWDKLHDCRRLCRTFEDAYKGLCLGMMLSTAVSTFGQNLPKVRRLILVGAFAEWGHPVFGNIQGTNNVQHLQQPGPFPTGCITVSPVGALNPLIPGFSVGAPRFSAPPGLVVCTDDPGNPGPLGKSLRGPHRPLRLVRLYKVPHHP
jgi:hypothetical protein